MSLAPWKADRALDPDVRCWLNKRDARQASSAEAGQYRVQRPAGATVRRAHAVSPVALNLTASRSPANCHTHLLMNYQPASSPTYCPLRLHPWS